MFVSIEKISDMRYEHEVTSALRRRSRRQKTEHL